METKAKSKTISRALTTVNAPLPTHIGGGTLLDCLLLTQTDPKWRPHVRAFFNEVHPDVIMDLVVEGSITFDNLAKAASFWDVEKDSDNARWIREMAPVTVAEADGPHASGHRFRHD